MTNPRFNGFLLTAFLLLFIYACGDDDSMPALSGTFKVSIENTLPNTTYSAASTTDVIMPGTSISNTFHAAPGSRLSFATMFVQTNDLFFAPADIGLGLYTDAGDARTGNITDLIDLWDAGTEVNQEPGVGVDQAPRQGGPNTGANENGTVEQITNIADGFSYPADEEVIRVELAHDGGTEFTLTISNISDGSSLPTPLAPGVYVIHTDGYPIFQEGQAASAGLEAIAEDGNNSISDAELAAISGYTSPLAPGVWAVHEADAMPFFTSGTPDRGAGLELLAEDGDPGALNTSLATATGVLTSGVFNTPVGASDAGPIFSGGVYEFTIDAQEGERLNFATMLIQTNDLFFAFGENGIDLFPNGTPLSGDITASVSLWDAGTEVNEYPGTGPNQPVRGGGNSGTAENGNVQVVNDGFTYPTVSNSIKVTITPQ